MSVSPFYPSPANALIDLEVRCGLCCRVPVWRWLHTLADLRIEARAALA
jgi:hypothetical protein